MGRKRTGGIDDRGDVVALEPYREQQEFKKLRSRMRELRAKFSEELLVAAVRPYPRLREPLGFATVCRLAESLVKASGGIAEGYEVAEALAEYLRAERDTFIGKHSTLVLRRLNRKTRGT